MLYFILDNIIWINLMAAGRNNLWKHSFHDDSELGQYSPLHHHLHSVQSGTQNLSSSLNLKGPYPRSIASHENCIWVMRTQVGSGPKHQRSVHLCLTQLLHQQSGLDGVEGTSKSQNFICIALLLYRLSLWIRWHHYAGRNHNLSWIIIILDKIGSLSWKRLHYYPGEHHTVPLENTTSLSWIKLTQLSWENVTLLSWIKLHH